MLDLFPTLIGGIMRTVASLVSSLLLCTGCYHATIETGRPPGPTKVEKPWAHGFLWGLVPPSTVETAQQCPGGVAKVETQQSFLNLVANVLTGGIYSPMQITVTCAQGGTADGRLLRLNSRSAREVIVEAIGLSRESGAPVYVELR
jgi:hypothetical protein